MNLRRFSAKCLLFLIALTLISSKFSSTIASTKTIEINDQEQFNYATFLYRSGEYYRSITEYKKVLYFFPNSPLVADTILQIGRCYMAGGELDSAIDHWTLHIQTPDNSGNIHLLLGLSYLDLDQHKVFTLREPQIEKGIQQLSTATSINKRLPEITHFIQDWQNRPVPEYKSPWVAGTLSTFLPGAGSAYTGRYREGFYAFFITALFYAAALEAYHQDEKALSLLLGSFTIAFYGGNIYTAINSAHKVNDKMDNDAFYRIRQQHGVWFIPETMNHQGTY